MGALTNAEVCVNSISDLPACASKRVLWALYSRAWAEAQARADEAEAAGHWNRWSDDTGDDPIFLEVLATAVAKFPETECVGRYDTPPPRGSYKVYRERCTLIKSCGGCGHCQECHALNFGGLN